MKDNRNLFSKSDEYWVELDYTVKVVSTCVSIKQSIQIIHLCFSGLNDANFNTQMIQIRPINSDIQESFPFSEAVVSLNIASLPISREQAWILNIHNIKLLVSVE
ncbi:MAG: hypothetical protein JNM21_07620 [Taibaiella sp.]|nr:hypothetical protein [Taibaiella sp.]